MNQTIKETISVLIPIFNEEENISPLYDKLTTALKKAGRPYEVIFIDDGSMDIVGPVSKLNRNAKTLLSFNRQINTLLIRRFRIPEKKIHRSVARKSSEIRKTSIENPP